MSGAAFEGLEHIASSPAGEDYRASERGFEMQFVRGLIEKVEAMSWDEVEECFTEVDFLRSVAIHYAALKACPADSFEGQTLLDAAVWIGGELLSPEKLERLPPTLLDPLVQALYLLGKNSFRIDTTSLSRNPPVAAGWLTGSKSHPLELTYLVNTDVVRFGTGVRHCRLRPHRRVQGRIGVAELPCTYFSPRTALHRRALPLRTSLRCRGRRPSTSP